MEEKDHVGQRQTGKDEEGLLKFRRKNIPSRRVLWT